jgi:hypothetical protein
VESLVELDFLDFQEILGCLVGLDFQVRPGFPVGLGYLGYLELLESRVELEILEFPE